MREKNVMKMESDIKSDMRGSEIPEVARNNATYMNIIGRTSVRRYTDEPVADDLKRALLHAAMSAPSGVNRQPWEFILVDDKKLLESLAEALPYAKMAAMAPMAIVPCGDSDRFLEGIDSELWVQDLSAVSENILLAAHALGLGGVWTCLYPHSDRMEAVRKILNVPDKLIPFNLIPIGHPYKHTEPMDKWNPERIDHNKI